MRRFLALLFVVALLGSGWHAPDAVAQDGSGYQVVINASNVTAAVERQQVARMFLKKTKSWPDSDLRVEPIDQGESSPTREAFTEAVHRKRVSSITSYWQRMIFSGRDVPPLEASSDQEVLEFVRARPGAIGYVAAGIALGDGVKVLTISE